MTKFSIAWEGIWTGQFPGLPRVWLAKLQTANATIAPKLNKGKGTDTSNNLYSCVQRAHLQHYGNYPEGQFFLKFTHNAFKENASCKSSFLHNISPERIGFILSIHQSYEYISKTNFSVGQRLKETPVLQHCLAALHPHQLAVQKVFVLC